MPKANPTAKLLRLKNAYIRLMERELAELLPTPWFSAHWSPRIEKGKQLQTRITDLEKRGELH